MAMMHQERMLLPKEGENPNLWDQQQQIDDYDEDEEQEVSLQGRASRHHTHNLTSEDSDPDVVLLLNENNDKTHGNENENGNTMAHDDEALPRDDGVEEILHFDYKTDSQPTFGFSGVQHPPTEALPFDAHVGYQEVDIVEKDARNSSATLTNHQNGREVEVITSFKPLDSGRKLSEDEIQVEESDLEYKEFDVETVLRKQNTHDLFCPKCNSCITRRVILRKRKRHIEDIHRRTKRDKFDTTDATNLVASSETSIHTANHDTIGNERDEPEVFRCLSCFSFFVPSGKSFKLFRCFGDKNDKEETQNLQQSATKSNWFYTIFTSDKGGKVVKGDNQKSSSEVKPIEQLKYPLLSKDIESQTENGHLVTPVATIQHVNGVKPEQHEVTINSSTCDLQVTSSETTIQLGNGETVTGVTSTEASISVKTRVTYSEDAITGEAQKLQHGNLIASRAPAEDAIVKQSQQSDAKVGPVGYDIASSIAGATLLVQSARIDEHVTDDIIQVGNDTKMVSVASTQVPTLFKTTFPYNAVEVKETGDDFVRVANGEAVKTRNFQVAQKVIGSDNTEVLLESGIRVQEGERRVEEGEAPGLDILKSIVYGGLIESITSLGVVTSAVGAGASTLNIVALGLANLIGGLFVIGHNLRELKKDDSPRTSTQTGEQATDRYYELLGRREKYILHVVIVILSYIIFGLVPPIVYGFSFRKSGNSNYKLATVSGVSLICVFLLALGKGHVRTPKSYIKTLLYYLTMAVMASGISYLVGILIEMLLDKLGWLDSSSFAIRDLKPEWSPY